MIDGDQPDLNALEPTGKQPSLRSVPDFSGLVVFIRQVLREMAAHEMGPELARLDAPSDLAQAVTLQIIEAADKLEYRGPQTTRALAKAMLVFEIASRLRALHAKKRGGGNVQQLPADSSAGSAAPVQPGPTPSAVVADRDLLEYIGKFMQRLSGREQRIVEMRIAGATHEEIGQALGISADYSQRLLARARATLRAADGEP